MEPYQIIKKILSENNIEYRVEAWDWKNVVKPYPWVFTVKHPTKYTYNFYIVSKGLSISWSNCPKVTTMADPSFIHDLEQALQGDVQ